MSKENVEIVRRMWEAFLENDLQAALSSYDPDVEWDGTNLPDGRVGRGLDAIMDHITRWSEMWESWNVEVERVIDAGDDQVIVFIRETGRTAAYPSSPTALRASCLVLYSQPSTISPSRNL
jgi:ketosteroid isomerase-like protein